jgi:hypothetical protein
MDIEIFFAVSLTNLQTFDALMIQTLSIIEEIMKAWPIHN